ncbi:MAG: DUF2339 domain-containing protein [SAR202 cluster bacterium]|nr:DUF2339 domain-containing protein [SAR202 cluster bacterium]
MTLAQHINCQRCSRQNLGTNTFCIYCGIRLSEPALQETESGRPVDAPMEEAIAEISETDHEASQKSDGTGIPKSIPLQSRLRLNNLENLFGSNWLVRIGVVAIFIGISFLMKLAIDEDFLTQELLVIAGMVSGVGFLVLGELLWLRYPIYAHALSGGGVALLYSSLLAALSRGTVDVWLAVGLLLLVSLISVGLAFKRNSQPLALLGVAGGLLAPFLYAGITDPDFQIDKLFAGQKYFLIIYVLVIDLGVIAVALFKNWRWFKLVSVIGSYAGFALWFGEYEDRNLSIGFAIVALTFLFFLLFLAVSGFHLIRRLSPRALDVSPMVWNALLYVIISYTWVLDQDTGNFENWRAIPTFGLGITHLLFAYLSFRTNRNQPVMAMMLGGIGLICISISVPMQFDGYPLLIGMSTNAAFLLGLSVYLKSDELKFIALISFIFAVVSLVSINPIGSSYAVRPLTTLWFIFLLYLSLIFYNKYKDGFSLRVAAIPEWIVSQEDLDRNYRWLYRVTTYDATQIFLLLSSNFLSIWMLSIEFGRFIESQTSSADTADQWKFLSITVLWAGYSTLLIIAGVIARSSFIRLGGLALMSLAVIKLFVHDTFNLEQFYRVAAYIVLGALLLSAGMLYQHYQSRVRGFFTEKTGD